MHDVSISSVEFAEEYVFWLAAPSSPTRDWVLEILS